jgi:pyruvate formate lyase activating enzyme
MAPDSEARGVVFNIQRYCVHDGGGIRTTVFLKGCPLRCRWCANPESQAFRPELGFNPRLCLGGDQCGRCAETCAENALARQDGPPRLDMAACNACMACAQNCPAGALHAQGIEKSVRQILDEVERDSVFYARSGGGMTLSGGEPLMQARFALALLREARRRRMDCALETSGHTPWSVLAAACALLREICFDIKIIDPQKHEAQTGVGNALILENFQRMAEAFPDLEICVRTPVVPGVNDSEDDINAILAFLAPFPWVKYELLPYHRLGAQKYQLLDRPAPMGEAVLDAARFEHLRALVARSRTSLSATVSGRE